MITWILFTLLAAVTSLPVSEKAAQSRIDDNYILPRDVIPSFYDVRLQIDPRQINNFTGDVSINIVPLVSTNVVVLQAMEMEILSVQVLDTRTNENLFESFSMAGDDTHFLYLQLTRQLNLAVPYVIHISYVSRYAENMFGLYVSSYVDENTNAMVNLVTSQLQPTFARRAFPCFDEPGFKAVFRTTIYAPEQFPVVRSNMPERTIPLKTDIAGFVKHEFEDTLIMSSYLLAYLVSEFDYIENTVDPTHRLPFRVYSRPGTQTFAEFALDFAQENLNALESYTEFNYAFPKMDKVAVPDFAAGAMENWGLVVYREVALLVQEGVTTTATKQNIARIISHENTHMWFGNEVSPQNWTYTWLNEGFANYFESFATDLVLPEWRMMDQFVINLQNVFQSDAVLSVNPMTHPVHTPSQVLGTFNSVAYQKSGSVIRMMKHILTPAVFKRGLAIYIEQNSRLAVQPPALYAALQRALDESDHSIPYTVTNVMNRWATQGGFPVLTVRRTAPTSNSFSVTQERFLTDRSLQSSDTWHVPINWVLSTDVNFEDTSPQAWATTSVLTDSIEVPGLSEAEWFMINKQQTGYYRVNYDEDNWRAVSRVLAESHATIHLLNRAQLVDDSFNLAQNGRLNYAIPLELSLYLEGERDYIPWAAANAAITYLNQVLYGSPVFDLYQQYLLHLTAPLYEALGFNKGAGEEHVTPYLRNIILNINCGNGNQDCIDNAATLLENFIANPTQRLDPDIQTTVYCSGLRREDAEESFQFFWRQYQSSTDSSEQSILLNSLGCVNNAELRTFYLNQVIADDSPVREQDRHTILVSVINSNPVNMEAALDFALENFHLIQPNVQGLTGTTNILNAFSRRLTTNEHRQKIDQLKTRHAAVLTAGELASIAAIEENIAASITWADQHLATVDGWLRDTYGSNASVMTSTVFVIISALLSIFLQY